MDNAVTAIIYNARTHELCSAEIPACSACLGRLLVDVNNEVFEVKYVNGDNTVAFLMLKGESTEQGAKDIP